PGLKSMVPTPPMRSGASPARTGRPRVPRARPLPERAIGSWHGRGTRRAIRLLTGGDCAFRDCVPQHVLENLPRGVTGNGSGDEFARKFVTGNVLGSVLAE